MSFTQRKGEKLMRNIIILLMFDVALETIFMLLFKSVV